VASKLPLKEQAMFLANSIWETGGLQYLKEIACSNGSCTYGKYYGRGYMQLTWDYNYKAASQDIYKDDRLVTNPDLAAQPEGAWATAVWFWTKNVRPAISGAIDSYNLGPAVKKINGALECPANQKAKNRLAIYNEILKSWNIASNNPGTLTGC
jgi:predicted chitinase